MGRKMTKGKQQILFNYLPGRTFDFEAATIARVTKIKGSTRADLNAHLILRKIGDEARAWLPEFRPALRDEVLRDPSRFVLLEPTAVSAAIFPRVFWCQNKRCGRIINAEKFETLPSKCPECRTGYLVQLRFVRLHRCGAIDPVTAPFCKTCKTSRFVTLDTRGAERFANFLWTCTQCKTRLTYFAGQCRNCEWPITQDAGPKIRNCEIEVHRAGRTFYAQSTVLLNIPGRHLDGLFARPDWPIIVAAKYLDFDEVRHISLSEFARTHSPDLSTSSGPSLSNAELEELLRRQASGEITAELMVAEMQRLRSAKATNSTVTSDLSQSVARRSGTPAAIWAHAGYELFESILPAETHTSISLATANPEAHTLARHMGVEDLTLESDYPVISATYAYTRTEYRPNQSRLNPFPPDPDHGGKFPIFVDEVQADALFLKLRPETVYEWLSSNGVAERMRDNNRISARSFFVRIFDTVGLKETVRKDNAAARMAFGLLHTLSHICVRRAGLLSGLEHTSLSEYLLPRSLSFAIYCNHRFGETIGALTALFEQSSLQWLNSITTSKKCVYDPVCKDAEGSCHACTHLAETSCRFFNLNLNRAFLFGGMDAELGIIRQGYLQFRTTADD